MLTASASTPNIEIGNHSKSAPTPDNWNGVSEGLSRTRQHLREGSDQEAVNTLKGILEFAPSEPQAWQLLGDILARHGYTNKATVCHEKAAKLEQHTDIDAGSTPPVSTRLAKLLWEQGENDSARAMLAILLLRTPDDENLHEMRIAWEGSV